MLDSTYYICFLSTFSILFPRQSSPAASDDNEKVWRRGLNLEEAFRERESADVVYVRVKIFSSYLNKAFCEILLKVPLTQRKHFVRFCTIAKMFPHFSCLEKIFIYHYEHIWPKVVLPVLHFLVVFVAVKLDQNTEDNMIYLYK